MPTDLARYGLQENPYITDRALDPRLFHDDKLIEVDGFSNIPQIDQHIREAIDNGQPPVFMITGKSGTGRSSLLNYVLLQYCTLSETDPQKLIVPKREYKGHDKVYTMKQWFGFLRSEINKKKIGISDETKADLQTYLLDPLEATLEPNFQDISNRISEEIAIAPYESKFACCIEDVEDFTIVDAALSIFAGVGTVCVFTVKDYNEQQDQIISPFREKCKRLTGSAILELNPLSGHEVSQLVDVVWSRASQLDNPFDLGCVAKVFGNRPRSIGMALTIMADLITEKLVHHPVGAPWPEAQELAFSCDQLKKLVPILETKV